MNVALQVDQTRTEGLIGASDAPAILGLDKWRPPISVWRELRGMPRDEPSAALREAAELGQILEPIVRGRYALKTGHCVVVPTKSRTFEDWLRCTPDGYAVPVMDDDVGVVAEDPTTAAWVHDIASGVGLVQIKTCSAYLLDDWSEGVPPKHEVQMRVEMAVCDLPWNDAFCLVGGQKFVGPYRVHRDHALEANILRDLRQFRDLVNRGEEPTVDHTDAWRRNVSERMRPTKVVMGANEEVARLISEWRMARDEIESCEVIEATIKNQLLLRMSAAGATAIDAGTLGKITAYKTGARMDWKGYATALEPFVPPTSAVLPSQFKAESKTWALRAPASWSKGEAEE